MADKNINVRIQNKSDTSTNWAKATSFVPKKGELIFYSDINKIKMGDGTTVVGSLPFLDARNATSDVYGNQINTTYVKIAGDTMTGKLTNNVSMQAPIYYIGGTNQYIQYNSTTGCVEIIC